MGVDTTVSFSVIVPSARSTGVITGGLTTTANTGVSHDSSSTVLHMAAGQGEKKRKRKGGVKIKDRTETKGEEDKKKEEKWRVILHNDEVHTFNYVIRSICKIIGTVDRKAAFEICVEAHSMGKSTCATTYKKQATQYCLGMQRQGLTASIAPDKDFAGGHGGAG